MEILSGMSFLNFTVCFAATASYKSTVGGAVCSRDNDWEIISHSLWKKIREKWQDDDFLGPRDYSNELDIVPHLDRGLVLVTLSDGFQETEGLFLAASQKFESVDESSEPELDELFEVALQHTKKSKLEDQLTEPISAKEIANLCSQQSLKKKQRRRVLQYLAWLGWTSQKQLASWRREKAESVNRVCADDCQQHELLALQVCSWS